MHQEKHLQRVPGKMCFQSFQASDDYMNTLDSCLPRKVLEVNACFMRRAFEGSNEGLSESQIHRTWDVAAVTVSFGYSSTFG